jgi:carbohydrate kinase (thermoresistant glucokinase family)
MGAAGSGKSTVGRLVAAELGARFVDADTLHTAQNVELMSQGTPLTDDHRWPWLHRVGRELSTAAPVVVACSALAMRYRDALRDHAADSIFVFLDAPAPVLSARLVGREGHFMRASMLDSQLAALEPLADDERGIRLDARDPPAALTVAIVNHLTHTRSCDKDR